MLGWHISVYRQVGGGASPAKAESPKGAEVAAWGERLSGLGWLAGLVERAEAVDLGGNGYPRFYTVQAKTLLRSVSSGPEALVAFAPGGPSAWVGQTPIDASVAKECEPEEWLLVEVWDES